MIMALYSNNRYELEIKYTSMIDLGSRPTLPRVDMTPLALYLNKLEQSKISKTQEIAINSYEGIERITSSVIDGEEVIHNDTDSTAKDNDEICEIFKWQCDRITDSGPLLRLNSNINKLSKAARYGHPYERMIYPSLISPQEMKNIVLSFFTHAYVQEPGPVRAKMDHEWNDLHEFNKNINWDAWKPPV